MGEIKQYPLAHEIGMRLCEIFGVSPDKVKGIDIRCHVGEAVTLRVERFVTDEEVAKLVTERYHVERIIGKEVDT